MQVKRLKVSDWIRITDNPIQRDTEKHAAKAKHLLKPLPIHAIVYAAQLPDEPKDWAYENLVKLDGHTRALLWKRNQVLHPPEVICNVIHVKDMEEAKMLYQTLDSKEALETVSDKVSGAFHEHNFVAQSSLLKAGYISSALRVAWAVMHDETFYRGGGNLNGVTSTFDIYKAIAEFSTELFALDGFNLKNGAAGAGIMGAFVLTYRRHGQKILPFWRAVFSNAGEKTGGKMDAVQALNELVLQRKGRGTGGTGVYDMTARAVMAAEKWLADEYLSMIPRPYELTGYIDLKRPAVKLIKKAV